MSITRCATNVWVGFQPHATGDSALPVSGQLSICRRSLRSIPKYFFSAKPNADCFAKGEADINVFHDSSGQPLKWKE